ncbi:MAG: hypothetical protein HZC45_03825 [Deltaproteobacteria bacterium]|nr:hypothetical protein [Deltaproteobacteria bacterium]
MEQYELLIQLVRCLESLGIRYIVTGSMASMAYGEPRLTNDIDVVADIKAKHIKGLKNCFPENEFYLSEEAATEAIRRQHQFNIIHPASGLKIDVIIRKRNAFDDSRFNRLKRIPTAENTEADFASPEDVIIKKMEFYKEGESEKHLRDITGILKVSGDTLDYDYINKWANDLGLKEIWDAVLKRVKK